MGYHSYKTIEVNVVLDQFRRFRTYNPIQHCVFRMIQIGQAKDDLTGKRLLVLPVPSSGLHTARMRRRYMPFRLGGYDARRKSAQAIEREATTLRA